MNFCKIPIVFFLIFFSTTNGTLSPGKGKKTKQKEIKLTDGPIHENVFSRNLIDEEPAAKDIYINSGGYYKDTSLKLFNGTILGYVTPWNNHGYDVAKIWGPKFNLISPVWLQILRKGQLKYELGGLHDIDNGWMKDVRVASKKKVKILPRVVFEKFNDKDFAQLLTYKEERDVVIELLLNVCKKHRFDGIVLEVWSQLSARVEDEHLITLVAEIAESLRMANLDIVLVVPPARKETVDLFSAKHFELLYPFITAFSLMTYDYSSIQRPGANAPLFWMRDAVLHICPESTKLYQEKRKKILLGLNMYGNDFTPDGGGAIIGSEFINLVHHVKGRLQFDEYDTENFFEIKTSTGRHFVFYPTLFSINERIKLATELGTGLSLWELGQGLDYFYDLF